VVVTIHELGHFLVARWCGVEVKTFSLGFGPEIAGFNDRHGTRWRIAAIPLGGYVRFLGDADAASTPDHAGMAAMTEEERKRSFPEQGIAARAAIVAAGPIANFLLAIAIFFLSFVLMGRPVLKPLVEVVEAGSAAEAAGFRAGDVFVSIDGEPTQSFVDVQRKVSISAGKPLTIVVQRAGAETTLKATPRLRELKSVFGTRRIGVLGIRPPQEQSAVQMVPVGIVAAAGLSLSETWYIVERTGAFLHGLVAGRESVDQVSGPLRIAKMSGVIATEMGISGLVMMIAFLSVSIGLINLLPVPMLDGGHLVFYAIEAVRGRPLSDSAQEFGFKVGLALVLLLIVVVTTIDIVALRSF
jgi:regulator of sigma E protease